MALTLPKIAVPQIALPNKKILAIVPLVIVLAVAGWFGWQYFQEPPPAPVAASKPQPVTAPKPAAPSPEKLIADVLAASGMNQQLNQLPLQLVAGIRQSTKEHSKASPAVLAAIEQAVTESYAAQSFRDRLSADLKNNYEQKRMQALLADLSAPAAKRMIQLEQALASPDTLAARIQLASQLSPERKELVKRIDAATRAGELAVETAFISMTALVRGMVGTQARKLVAVDKAIDKQRATITANIRNSTFTNLAFSYKDASDAELDAYAKFCETENRKWFSGIVYASVLEETRSAATQAGERMGALAAKPGKGAAHEARPARSKSGADARVCLDLATDIAIMKCAEAYR